MDLRKLLKCPVTVALLILWAALSVVGYLGKDTIYKNYTVDIRTTPYFVLVFDGLHDGIFPWSHVGAPGGIGENGKLPPILLPGETFSYNEVVGQRTAARGFQEAGAYLNGKTVQELGGGICQVSSTLYCATVLSNLEIVHRENHMFESTYVPLGLDATVSWGGPDYVFKNNTKYPIKVVAGYANGVCTCEIWGTKTDNITVKFVNEVLSRNPYSTVTVKDDTKPVGYSAVTEEGENGSKVQTYRELYDGSGKLISRTKESFSVYTRRNQVVTVGTKKAEQKKKKTKKTDKKKNKQKQDTDQTAG